MVVRVTVMLLFGVGLGLVFVGVGCFGPISESAPNQAGGLTGDLAAPVPISAADAAEPTPVNDPGANQTVPETGTTDPIVIVVVPGSIRPGTVNQTLPPPSIGWGNTINLLDLLALLPAESLGDVLNPATQNPGSFTTLELLCLDEGFSDSFCRSRYGAR